MIQILFLLVGAFALIKGELTVTRSRKLAAMKARGIGVGFVLAAGLPLLFGGDDGFLIMLGVGVALTVVAFLLTSKSELADEIPMK